VSSGRGYFAVRATRRIWSAIAKAVEPHRWLRKSKELSDLSIMQGHILSLKYEPHPLMIWVNPNYSIKDYDPLLIISATEGQKRV
jgi:hypothetical protein